MVRCVSGLVVAVATQQCVGGGSRALALRLAPIRPSVSTRLPAARSLIGSSNSFETTSAGDETPRRRVQHFINLTNGLEALEALEAARGVGFSLGSVSFCRIQSSHCEANDFWGILQNLDHNLLFHLATGADCVVYDFGSRRTRWPALGDDDAEHRIPRAVWWGVEWSRYALERLWHVPKTRIDPPLLRGYAAGPMFDQKLGRIPKPLYKKLKYYRKFEPTAVRLRGVYRRDGTTHDGDDAVYRAMARDYAAAVGHRVDISSAVSPHAREASVVGGGGVGGVATKGRESCQLTGQQEEGVASSEPPEQDLLLDLPPGFVEYRSSNYVGIGRHLVAATTLPDEPPRPQ